MATTAEYAAVTVALQRAILAEEQKEIPAWEQGAIPATLVSDLASLCAHTAIDALDALRAKSKPPST